MERLPLEASPSDAMLAIWDALRALGRTLGEPVPGDNDVVQVEREEYLALKELESSVRTTNSYAIETKSVISFTPTVGAFYNQLDKLDKVRRSIGIDEQPQEVQ